MKQNKHTNLKATLLAIGIVVGMPLASALAYYPERNTFSIKKPANFITFNSITDNPNYGDERNFTLAKPSSNTSAGGWSDTYVNITHDDEYLVRVYVHNNASANLNLVAENTRVRVSLPTNTAKEIRLGAFISANNAKPKEVYDDVIFRSDKLFNIAYVAGSARFKNNVNPNPGFNISDDLVTNRGALIGYNKMDGRLPGCFEYSGILTFKVKIQTQKQASFNIQKQVRKSGEKKWSKQIKVNPGEKVEYQLMYKNTGQATQTGVIVKDFLPNSVNAIGSSLMLKNAHNPNAVQINNQEALFNGAGLKIGDYASGANAFMKFSATMPTNDQLKICGDNIFRNRVVIYTKEGNLEDVADVVVTKTGCTPEKPQPNQPTPNQPTPNKPTPNNPGELPSTGPAEIAISMIGLLLITASVIYWYKSQQEIKKRITNNGSIEMKISDQPTKEAPTLQSTDKK